MHCSAHTENSLDKVTYKSKIRHGKGNGPDLSGKIPHNHRSCNNHTGDALIMKKMTLIVSNICSQKVFQFFKVARVWLKN